MRVSRERVANFVEMRSTNCRRAKSGALECGGEGGFYVRCRRKFVRVWVGDFSLN